MANLDLNSIGDWLNDVYLSCIPDFDALLSEDFSTTFGLFSDRLYLALGATLNALTAWLKLLFYLCRLLIHIILFAYPYIKPLVTKSYKYWNSLDLTVQLSIIGFIIFILISYWIKKNHYIQKTSNYFNQQCDKIKNWFKSKWNSIILWISIRSKMTAKIFPHLIWWIILCSLIWFIPDHIYASHHVLLFFFCFIIPSVKTYSVIRKYSDLTKSSSTSMEIQKKKIQECIDPLKIWLQFWSCRAFILFTYSLIIYLLSWIPTIAIDYAIEWYNNSLIVNYININPALSKIICDWAILWLLVMDTSLQFLSHVLSSKIFQFEQSIHFQSSQRREIRSRNTSLADKISLSSINSLLSFVLNILRPFVPSFIYNIIHDGLYQVVIFGSFLFISPVLGSHILGYLLPIYTSILALHNLQELQHKISLWNNNQRQDLITPQISSLYEASPGQAKNGGSNLRSRKNGTTNGILSPPKEKTKTNQQTENSNSWSSSLWNLIPTNMFSFNGRDDLEKAERKRQEMHKEADYVIGTIVDRLKYWIVFATLQWIYYFIGEQIGLQFYIPLWNHVKFALILWIQLPYVPYSAFKLYEFIILPIRILDITHIEHDTKKMDDYIPNSTDEQLSVSVSPIQRRRQENDHEMKQQQRQQNGKRHKNGIGGNGKLINNGLIEQPSGTKMSQSFQNLLNSDDESEENS